MRNPNPCAGDVSISNGGATEVGGKEKKVGGGKSVGEAGRAEKGESPNLFKEFPSCFLKEDHCSKKGVILTKGGGEG